MKNLTRLFGALLVILTASQAGHAADQPETGLSLLQEFWSTLESGDMRGHEALKSKAFQSAHEDGGRDLVQTQIFIQNLNHRDHALSEIRITEEGPAIIATYFVTASQTLGDKRLPKRKTARMTVFLESDEGWKVIAHANLNPLNK